MLGINVIAIEADQCPFPGLHAYFVECRFINAEFIEFPYGIGLQVDPNAQRFDLGYRLKNDTGHAYLVKGQGYR
jgi:hypothetical protein